MKIVISFLLVLCLEFLHLRNCVFVDIASTARRCGAAAMSLSPADMKLPLTPTITEPLVVEQPENHRWPLVKKIAWMSLSLVAGIAFAVGHHSFYHGLDGTPPPSTSYAVWGFPHGYSKQQLNISIGNTLAFLAKAFLAVAIATAHDQINWRAIKRSPTELGLIDALFSAREAIPNALNARMWWHMPVPAILLLLFWYSRVGRYVQTYKLIASQAITSCASHCPINLEYSDGDAEHDNIHAHSSS